MLSPGGLRSVQHQVDRVEAYLARHTGGANRPADRPVVFLNASTRIQYLSQNAAFQQLAAWAVALRGVATLQLVCDAGLRQCMLGTRPENPAAWPPCRACRRTSRALYRAQQTRQVQADWDRIAELDRSLAELNLQGMRDWDYSGFPLGELCLPSLRWALRRWSLPDDAQARTIYRQYLSSAAVWLDALRTEFDRVRPRALVVFNGITFPEAVARSLAGSLQIPTVTHEVGLRRHSAYFSHREATFRAIDLPEGTELSSDQDQQLDAYLESRFRGEFTMADVKFWPEMTELPEWLRQRIDGHREVITLFTNVVFDTSQAHANTIFLDMFAWLDSAVNTMRAHPEQLFIVRAHPDEDRAGKASEQSVASWYSDSAASGLGNVVFIPPTQTISSYDLIRRSKLVLVYNSSIGLEASILGAPVVCAGRARYGAVASAYFPASATEYEKRVDSLLREPSPRAPSEFRSVARKFLYYELFKASLDLSRFMVSDNRHPGHVLYRPFAPSLIGESEELDIVGSGILEGAQFAYP